MPLDKEEPVNSRPLTNYKVYVKKYEHLDKATLEKIYRSRKNAFIDRRKWDIESYDGGDLECDKYDNHDSVYLYTLNASSVTSCVRLRPSTVPTLLSGPLKWLKAPSTLQETETTSVWEASRFFITPINEGTSRTKGTIDVRTVILFLGMIEFGLAKEIDKFEVVVDALMARIVRRSGWKLDVLDAGTGTSHETIYYGLLDCSKESHQAIRRRIGTGLLPTVIASSLKEHTDIRNSGIEIDPYYS
ncbi:acyl-homoserine-lactone synthase [Billgrantia endophytica]|uniref:Acyl-homoserine-lactone synthase n=1 Tax=Billgrantia endophytica TaxID=2033802 RepID=A0A2N7UE68_9GAMM|nr:acyl-homoserine-lactone synthase [Halomonas endophytica]PMR78710.1 hypothetical protein C1H69_00070 [Halomonas endophytica]